MARGKKAFTPEQAADLQKQYDAGATLIELAGQTGVSTDTISRHIDTSAKRGRAKSRNTPPRYHNKALELFSKGARQEVVRLYTEEGLNFSTIAQRMNASGKLNVEMTRYHVDRILEMANVPTRRRG